MTKTVAIVQSNYIPWKGYFDLIQAADEFILFDDVQYTRRDWRNRNIVKTPHGKRWLTIPVATKGRYTEAIKDIQVSDPGWSEVHWNTLAQAYAAAPFFGTYRGFFEDLYRGAHETRLSLLNHRFLQAICGLLGIQTRLTWSMDYSLREGRTERLVDLCRQAGAGRYLSGPSARAYVDADLFDASGIELEFFDYSGYKEYPQLYAPFDHHVSIVDLILNVGPDARDYLLTS